MPSSPSRTAFVAGASGAIGSVLCQLLLQDGWRVVGTTRSSERAEQLHSLGVVPAVLDVFNRQALFDAVRDTKPEIVVHQLTDLPKQATPESMAAARVRNARIREIGTDNLVAAAVAAGAKRIVAQSIAFAYLQGPQPYTEASPLDSASYASVITLEDLVLGSGLKGIVLRYGRLYGPSTWAMSPPANGPVHVHAAADAARKAMTLGSHGVYNVAEDDGFVSSERARVELNWNPAFRLQPREG